MRILVAMSGGVDSSVAALLLQEQGHEVVGLFMRHGQASEARSGSCCSVSDARDARRVADRLGVPFHAVDLTPEFGRLIDDFAAAYAAGRTPNPCAVCNRDLKFDRLFGFADAIEADGVATGHYARLDSGPQTVLRRGVDAGKDQSYYMFAVAEEALKRTLLPVGGMSKAEVRSVAERAGFPNADKPDSQEICFVPTGDYRDVLRERGVKGAPGAMTDTSGRALGWHRGIEGFTVGQRRGLGLGGGAARYVVNVDAQTATVEVGSRDELLCRSFVLSEPNPIGFCASEPPADLSVQVRALEDPLPCTLTEQGGSWAITLGEPAWGVAPGQAGVLYSGDRCLGGGWISLDD